MMRSFICKTEQKKIVGFDLDGTLYDEFDFIAQAYLKVAEVIADYTKTSIKSIYQSLCLEWLKYGSSKKTLFQDTYQKYAHEQVCDKMLEECIVAYRTAPFELNLSHKAELILEYLKNKSYEIFLITDGNSDLQRRKIQALQLEKWFNSSNIAISGDYGKNCQKPSLFMIDKIQVLQDNLLPVLYLGDRIVDQMFAEHAGFDFMKVKNMNCVEE